MIPFNRRLSHPIIIHAWNLQNKNDKEIKEQIIERFEIPINQSALPSSFENILGWGIEYAISL